MAAKEEKTNMDQFFEDMKNIAIEQQQCFYELLPDCTVYKSDNDPEIDQRKYLKQNIGYALFGPPMKYEEEINKKKNNTVVCYGKTENPNNAEADITDAVSYGKKAKKAIDKIYNRICDDCLNMKDDPFQSIYFGVIYNVIVYSNTNVKSKKKEKVKEATKKETEAELKEATKKETETEVKEDENISVVPVPIFKIFKNEKSIQGTVNNAKEPILTKNEEDCETQYIDANARVYKSWSNYIENNTLQKCTMVLPKDGFYQPNPDCPIEEDYSTVWIEIMDSPACATKNKILENVDHASTVVGIGTFCLAIVEQFIPFPPVASISIASANAASSVWSMIRNIQESVDRVRQSIYILDEKAFPSWLGLTGSVASLEAIGGSAILSRAAVNGATIPSAAKIVFNTMQGGNLFLNGTGVAYMSYSMYEKYMEEQTFSWLNALNLATHVVFFASSVMNVKFANDIIKNSQGRIIDDHKKTRYSKNLRRKFDHAARKAAENNTCKIIENAEIIHFIRNHQDLLSFEQVRGQMFDEASQSTIWSFDQGIFSELDQSHSSDFQDNSNNFAFNQLKRSLHDLLTELCPDDIPELSDFDEILEDLSSMNINEDHLKLLFNIAVTLMKHEDLLSMCFTFVWKYCKANLEQWGIKTRRRMESESGSYIMRKIIIVVSEATGIMFDNLATAAFMYVGTNLHKYEHKS